MSARVGRIYRDAHFYVDPETGQLKPKYFLVLAAPSDGDIVIRLLTSRYSGLRPETPPCSHGDPYPGFFLGIPAQAHPDGRSILAWGSVSIRGWSAANVQFPGAGITAKARRKQLDTQCRMKNGCPDSLCERLFDNGFE